MRQEKGSRRALGKTTIVEPFGSEGGGKVAPSIPGARGEKGRGSSKARTISIKTVLEDAPGKADEIYLLQAAVQRRGGPETGSRERKEGKKGDKKKLLVPAVG